MKSFLAYLLVFLGVGLTPCIGQQEPNPTELLKQLVSARGGNLQNMPGIKISKRQSRVASYSPRLNQIVVEQKAYDVCRSLGSDADDALAFLISHEYTHYLQHHIWQDSSSDHTQFFANARNLQAHLRNERTADRYGAFLTYLAGFNVYRVAPKVIQHLYVGYGIDTLSSSKYPPLQERQALTLQVCDQVRDYSTLFEIANLLQLTGRYSWSQSIYTYLLRYLDLPEIYYNAGLNQFREVLQARESAVYPVELVPSLNLRDGLSDHPDTLLIAAFENLNQAALRQTNNHEIFIALLAVCLEQREGIRYKQIKANLLAAKPLPETLEKIRLLDAIELALRGSEVDARTALIAIEQTTNDDRQRQLARDNLALLAGLTKSATTIRSMPKPVLNPLRELDASPTVLDSRDPLAISSYQIDHRDRQTHVILKRGRQKLSFLKLENYQHSLFADQINLPDFSEPIFLDPQSQIFAMKREGDTQVILYR